MGQIYELKLRIELEAGVYGVELIIFQDQGPQSWI
jgi:hypothetical protein